MLQKEIIFFGQKAILSCDGKCNKAWGRNSRERIDLDDDDDCYWPGDDELGEAPDDPGTYEGSSAKPQVGEDKLNKWCCRECERSTMTRPDEEVILKDWSKRRYNQPDKHEEDVAE